MCGAQPVKIHVVQNEPIDHLDTSLLVDHFCKLVAVVEWRSGQFAFSLPFSSSYYFSAPPIKLSSSIANDQNALVAFKNSLITLDPNNDILAKNWSTNGTTTSVCYWIGVSCGVKRIRVIALNVSGFVLTGTLPPHLGNLTFLRYIDVSSNNFSGLIPSEMSRLRRLREIDLGDNSFNGDVPSWFGDLPHLEILSLRNNLFSGPIHKQIWNCTSMRELYLQNNYFTGSIPSKLLLFNLEKLHLDHNKLSGEIPSSINDASKLIVLQFSNNSFSGSIPYFGSLRLLQRLYISGNNLSGSEYPNQELTFLSSLTNCRLLEVLEVAGNPLSGILPAASVGNLSTSLKRLILQDCNIMGVIPCSIGNLTGLQSLDLSRNQLTGTIPAAMGKLYELQGLYIGNNQLQGYMPTDLCRLSRIVVLNLNDNNLTGPIPKCLGETNSLREINLASNKLNSTIPYNFWNLKDLIFLNLSSNYLSGQLSSDIESLKAINSLDLSHNQFSGKIPISIINCQSLEFLSLSNNKFEGSITPFLGDMRGLTTLDLSNNNLSGSIPISLESLNLLQYFNVSHNKLEGEVPTGGRFSNFTAQSFSYNYALCGSIKFKVPPCGVKDVKDIITSRCKDNITAWCKDNETLRLNKDQYILPPFIISLVIFVTIIIIYVLIIRRQCKLKRVQARADVTLGATWRRVSYIELARGTNSFSTETNLLGRGSFGSVFKATLPGELVVAVKVFDLQSQRSIRSFDTECEILSNIRHRNLVQIISCCSNTEFKALVLEHIPNESLEKWLYSENCCLNLRQRLQIAIEVALALQYLHHDHTFTVVHCDIKPSNVLLDEDMVAHLADFGISKLFEDGEAMVHTKTFATIGYAAPEYGSEGKVSTSGDVYSYGILLLEMFTKKKPTDDMFGDEMSLREWVCRALQENAVTEVAAPDLLLSRENDQNLSANQEECVSSIFSLAMKCLATAPDERINMIEMVRGLQRIKDKVVAMTRRRRRYA